MTFFPRLPGFAACAAAVLWPALLAAECRPGCQAAGPARILGFDYAGTPLDEVAHLRREDLPGALKMSGTWVSKLTYDPYLRNATAFCRYAQDRGQDAWLQVPVTFTTREVTLALDRLAALGCRPKGFAIGNEVERMVTEHIATSYTLADYVTDYNRIVPLVAKRFPTARIVALELASFTVKDPVAGDGVRTRYRPIFEWLLPFLESRLVRRPDYVSVHYYPFTGAQREWETLAGGAMFRRILDDLEPYLRKAPPLLIGEFNATYQYEDGTVYPGSGGESFMAALLVPEMLHAKGVAGVFHWAIADKAPSTLGLVKGATAVPLFEAYRMMVGVQDHALVTARTETPHVEAHAFKRDGHFRTFAVNRSPFFARNAEVRVEHCGCTAPIVRATLPPLSITELRDGAAVRHISYSERSLRSVAPTAPACVPLADFSQPPIPGVHFENPRFNQNAKIGTGGTFLPVSSPGATATLRNDATALSVDCVVPGSGSGYYQCGVKLPLVADADGDRQRGRDWSHGLDTGMLRVTLESDAPVAIEIHLEDFRPEAVGHNPHRANLQLAGRKTFTVALRAFQQAPGFGIARPLKDVLRDAASLRIETRQPGFTGRFRVHRVDVCDVP
ncbi:MAG: hypothetical protein ABIR98_02310 [Usitatibacter sp.]